MARHRRRPPGVRADALLSHRPSCLVARSVVRRRSAPIASEPSASVGRQNPVLVTVWTVTVGLERNPHAAAPFTDDDAAIAAALQDVSVPALLCSLVHMTGDPSWIRGELRPQLAMINDYTGGMTPEMLGGGPAPGPARRDRLPRRRVRTARPAARGHRGDDGVHRSGARRSRRHPDVPRRPPPRRRRQPGHRLGRRDPRRGQGRLAGRRHRLWRGGAARRHPPGAGRPAVHHHREGRRPGRHVVGQPLPRGTGRHRQPLLLLLVRARRPLERVLLPAARAARLLRPRARQPRHRRALPLPHRGGGGDLRRGDRSLGGRGPRARRRGRHARRPLRDQRGRLAQPPAAARHPGDGRLPGSVVPLGPVAGRRRVAGHPLRARRRRGQRVPDRTDDRRRGRPPDGVPAHGAVDVPQPQLPPPRPRRRRLGDAPPAVLRPLVPLPDVLPGRRVEHGSQPDRPGLRLARRQRGQ